MAFKANINFDRFEAALQVVDAHTVGEFCRMVIGGFPEPEGNTMIEKKPQGTAALPSVPLSSLPPTPAAQGLFVPACPLFSSRAFVLCPFPDVSSSPLSILPCLLQASGVHQPWTQPCSRLISCVAGGKRLLSGSCHFLSCKMGLF